LRALYSLAFRTTLLSAATAARMFSSATEREWLRRVKSVGDWSAWLAAGDRPEQLEALRRHVERGLPCGSQGFVRRLERRTGQMLRPRAAEEG